MSKHHTIYIFIQNWDAIKHLRSEKTISCLPSSYCPIKRHPFTSARITDRWLQTRTIPVFQVRKFSETSGCFLDLFKLTQSFQSSWTLSFTVSVFLNTGTIKSTLGGHLNEGRQENLDASLWNVPNRLLKGSWMLLHLKKKKRLMLVFRILNRLFLNLMIYECFIF